MIINKMLNEIMESRKPTFTAVVDAGSEWYEITETFEEAVTMLRDLVEADHHHVFVKVTKWMQQSHGPNASIACHVCWVDTMTGATYSKTIRINGITYKDCGSYWHRY